MHKRVPRAVFWAIFVAAVVGVGIASVEQRSILDWLALRSYQPPAIVQQLATETTMDAFARKIFYVNHPQIDDKGVFNQACSNESEQTIVLGCYHPDQAGIFVLKVTDSRLDGVEEVTAAHEMLHAAYDRLDTRDRNYVDGLLMDYYQHDLHDQRIIDTMNAYKKTEPGQLVNEMHSVFGTEISNLPTPLENYYKRYFTDRHKITGFAAQYEAAFTTRQAQIKAYDTQLANMKQQITADEDSLKSQASNIDVARTELDNERNSGDISAYNAGVPKFNASIDTYNTLAVKTRGLITQYNQIVERRNAIALEENKLSQDLSSDISTINQ
jgi:hypothetical protein